MKKIIALLLCLGLTLGAVPAFAADSDAAAGTDASPAAAPAEKTVITLSQADAVKLMQTQSTRAETAALHKRSDEAVAKGYSEGVKDVQEQLKALSAMSGTEYYETASHALLSAGVSRSTEKMLKKQREFAKAHIDTNVQAELNQIEKDTVEIYSGLLQARENLRVCRENLKVQQDIYNNVQLKYKHGTAARIDVRTAENALVTAQQTVNSAEAAERAASMNLNMLLEYELDQQVVLSDSLVPLPFPEISVDDAVAAALANRPETDAVAYLVDIQQMLYNRTSATTNHETSTFLKQQVTLEEAKKTQKDLPKQLELGIRVSYDNLKNLYAAVDSAKNTAALAEEAYKIALLTFDSGLNTLTDVQQAEIRSFQAKQGVLAAITSYNLAVYDFNYSIGVGTTRLSF